MDEPTIRYAKADDGLGLAYWTLGNGPSRPLIVVPAGGTNIEGVLFRVPQAFAWHQRLAEGRMVVRYDRRGAGLSDWPEDKDGWDHARHVADIGAVAGNLGFTEYDPS